MSDQSTDPSLLKEDAVEFKWTPLARDYEFEYECLTSLGKKETTLVHPLLPKEILNKINANSTSNSKTASSSSNSLLSASSSSSSSSSSSASASSSSSLSSSSSGVFDPLRLMKAEASSRKKIDVNATLHSAIPESRLLTNSNSNSNSSSGSGSTITNINLADNPLAAAYTPVSPSSSSSSSSFSLLSSSSNNNNNNNNSGSDSLNVIPVEFSGVSGHIPGHMIQSWRDRRSHILVEYTTNKKIPVSANFLDEEVDKGVVAVDQSQSRLEELSVHLNAESHESKNLLSQQEYISHIESQHDKLKAAWEQGERVLSLKIAIQCAKLLGDTMSVPQMYPSMFVLLTEILDTFGELVYARIKSRGVEVYDMKSKTKSYSELPYNFKLSDVSATARETASNWFYKTACIRELMPRIYVDLCLLKTYRYLEPEDEFPAILLRLSKSIRGIGDPLAATYARAYLCVKAGDLYMSFKNDHLKAGECTSMPKYYQAALTEAFDDTMYTFKQLSSTQFSSISVIKEEKIRADEYQDLFAPAIQFILNNIGFKANRDLFFALLQQYKDYCTTSVVLLGLIGSFDPSYVSAESLEMVELIKNAADLPGIPKSKLYLALGKALVISPPPQHQRLPLLNDVWKAVTKIKEPQEYMDIAQVFIQYLLMNFTDREVNIFLRDVIKHVKKDNAYKHLQDRLCNVVCSIMSYSKELAKVLSMDTFLPVLDLLDKKTKVTAAKAVLVRFSQSPFKTCDPVIIHTLFDVAKSLHDSVDSLSFDDERRQISLLLIHFIRQIDYGRDLEQQLNTYVDCRAAFTSLDLVTAELIQRSARLAMQALRFMKGHHSKKTAAFVKACLAYCHITIPSLDDMFHRLRLLLLCGQVAMMNGMVGQGEAFFKAAVSLIPECPPTIEIYKQVFNMEEELVTLIRHLTSALLLFPGHPENGPFYLVKGLIAAIAEYPHWRVGGSARLRVYLGILSLFCAYYQRKFILRIDGLESNDDMYGGDANYMHQIAGIIDGVISEILVQLTKIGEKGDTAAKKSQCAAALDFVNVLVSSFVMNNASATLVVKLFQLAQQNSVGTGEDRYIQNTLKHIQNKRGVWYQDLLTKIDPSK